MYYFLKRIIIILLACLGVAYCQPAYEVFELPLGKLEDWKRNKTTNPNATDKLPVYYVAGDYLLRIEPTNNYYTQLFNKDYKMVWETNTPLLVGYGIDFTNHAQTIFHNNKYIYQVDYGLNYGGGILKIISLASGENKSTQFTIGLGEGNLPTSLHDKANPFFVDDMMYIVLSKGEKTYLSSINNSGVIVNKLLDLKGTSTSGMRQLGFLSNEGGWVYAEVEDIGKYLVRKLSFDYNRTILTNETAWMSLSGTTTSGEKIEIPFGSRDLRDAESFCWMENNVTNTLIVTLAKGDKSESNRTFLTLNKFVEGNLVVREEYTYWDQIKIDSNIVLGGTDYRITHPKMADGKFNFKIEYYRMGLYWLLDFSADKDLKLNHNNSLDKDAYETAIKNMVVYTESGGSTPRYKPQYFDIHRSIHQYINAKNRVIDKHYRYIGLYFNKKYILIRDDYYTVNPTVFQFSFE